MHKEFMLAALEQAWLGRGACAPNPSVGAVLVHKQQIVARAFHAGVGKPHAEQALLEGFTSKDFDDLTLYVTLEPCNHWGRTPPCVDIILQHPAIRTVVFGYRDPNPVVAENNTPQILQHKNIHVQHYPLVEIDRFYRSYTRWMQTNQPWVTIKLAQTLDGKIAGEQGQPIHLSNASCSQFTHKQRLHSDILLTTAQTILKDNPAFTARLGEQVHSKPLAILDRRLRLKGGERVFQQNAPCHIFHDMQLAVVSPIEDCYYHPVPCHAGYLDLPSIFDCLGELGCHDVWIEAGGQLFSQLHAQKLIDITYIYVVPEFLGQQALLAYADFKIPAKPQSVFWLVQEDNAILKMEWMRSS